MSWASRSSGDVFDFPAWSTGNDDGHVPELVVDWVVHTDRGVPLGTTAAWSDGRRRRVLRAGAGDVSSCGAGDGVASELAGVGPLLPGGDGVGLFVLAGIGVAVLVGGTVLVVAIARSPGSVGIAEVLYIGMLNFVADGQLTDETARACSSAGSSCGC